MSVACSNYLNAAKHQAKLLEDLIQNNELRQQFNDQIIIDVREKAPPFIKRIKHSKTPVVLVSIKSVEEPFKVPEPVIKEKEKKSLVELQVTGNPLPSPFTDEQVELLHNKIVTCEDFSDKEKFHPLNIYHARELLALYGRAIGGLCKDMKINSEDICPVYIPCDGSDGTKISLLQTEAKGTKVNSYMFATQQYKCGETKMKELRLNAIKELMNKPFSRPITDNTEVKIDCFHQMEYFGMQRYVKLNDDNFILDGCGIQIKIVWCEKSRKVEQLDCVPPNSAIAILEAPLDYKHKRWDAPILHSEIVLLKALAELLDQDVVESNQEVPAISGNNELAKPGAALELLQYASTQPFENAKNQQFVPNKLDELVDIVEKESRPNMDITDFMWNAFKYCKTVDQIAKCIHSLLENCVTQTPTISPKNNSKIATIIKAIPLQVTIPFVFPKLAVELMVEIGFIKITRDIQFLCDASGAYGPNDALTVCGWNLNDWKIKVNKIERAVQCVELVLQGNSLLGMNSESMNYLFKEIFTMPGSNISVNLKASYVMNLIKGMYPQLRRWTIKPESDNVTPQMKNTIPNTPDKNKHQSVVQKSQALENKIQKHFIVCQYPILPWIETVEFELTDSDKPVLVPKDLEEKTVAQKTAGHIYCTTVTHNINY